MLNLDQGRTQKEIAARFSKATSQSYLRDWIYGGIDGTITTFAVVSGVVGGQLPPLVILILGFANLLADGFSMAASNYLGSKAELEQQQNYQALESKHIEIAPRNEKDEIRQIFRNKGLEGDTLEDVVNAITSNKPLWINTLLQEEYGLSSIIRSPLKAALYTFLSFVFFGLMPLLPYILAFSNPFFWSCFLTGLEFFIIGSVKSHWSLRSWWYSGIETLTIGTIAAALAYIIGLLLHFYLVGI